ncbi:MAG: sortase, partial [Actinobacteria bacterium]|nr:sortase [Actinomycetota bacterium]
MASAASSSDAGGEVPWTPGVVQPPPADGDPWGVWIPRLGVEASLAGLGLDDRGALDVPDRPEIAGWYVGGPRPGEVGPTVVAGHVDSRTGPAVFARLHELREGDVAHLVYRDGFVVTYRVRGVERYDKDAFPT